MAGCHPTGRLWTEIHNLPLDFLWMLIEHSPAGDDWMRGDSFKLLKKRIVILSKIEEETVEEKAKTLRDIKLANEMLNEDVVPSKEDVYFGWAGGAFTCRILEEEMFN